MQYVLGRLIQGVVFLVGFFIGIMVVTIVGLLFDTAEPDQLVFSLAGIISGFGSVTLYKRYLKRKKS